MADNENLNEQVEEVIDMSTVITVPIDDTLSNSGEAADAKAVGDALALKADKSEIQTAITVNGQSADAQGAILVNGTEIPMSGTDSTTLKAAIEAVDGKTGADIPIDSGTGAQTIKQAITSAVDKTADQIEMSASDETTVKSAIDTTNGNVNTLSDAVTALQGRTGADIPYNTGSAETIKQHVDALEAGKVKTVNEIGPDANGNIEIDRVSYADNLYTDEMEQVDGSFLIRTTGDSLAISGEDAWLLKALGNRVHNNFTAESLSNPPEVTPMPRTAPAAITASITEATFLTKVSNTTGTYTFTHDGENWKLSDAAVTITEYGITVTNDPISGDEIVVVVAGSGGSYTATMTVNAATRTAPAAITATIDRDTWVGYVNTSGTYTFAYSTEWKLGNDSVDLEDYGIAVTNTPIAGDQIAVTYVKEVRGTIVVANPATMVATGWNLYDHTHGYARVVKYSETYGYAISGTYTSLAFKEDLADEGTAITPDADGLFSVTGTGYVVVTGGNGTDTAIWPTWSDWTEGYDGSWEGYSESTVSLATIMSSYFPYGLCKVGTIRDEIDLVNKVAISRISRSAYSDEARATAADSGRAYEFDENYLYIERETPVTNSITLSEKYTVNDHGMEWFTGSDVEVYTEILYGQNLKDRLRRDVITIREQSFNTTQKAQARTNIGAAAAADLTATNTSLGNVMDGLAIVANGNTHAAIAAGQFVYVKGHGTLAEGLYTANAAIGANATLSSSNLTADASGGLNALNGNIANKAGYETGLWTPHIYDNNTKVAEMSEFRYYKVGPMYFMYGQGFPAINISTMLQIRNLPCSTIIAAGIYHSGVEGNCGDRTVQRNGSGAVYFRPNITGNLAANTNASFWVIGY